MASSAVHQGFRAAVGSSGLGADSSSFRKIGPEAATTLDTLSCVTKSSTHTLIRSPFLELANR